MKTALPPLFRLVGVALALVALANPLRAMTEQERRAHLEWMLKSLPDAPQFKQWQQRTGEIPPDFDAFPRNNFLPDPFTFMSGRAVRNASDWTARRAEIRQLLEKWDVGSVPPKATTFRTTVQSETPGNGYVTRVVEIEYGPRADKTTTVTVTLTIPQGNGPFPVMIGGAASSLIRRGYIACSYSGSVDAPGTVAQLYPEHDFASMGQVAFTMQTVVDHLLTVPQVDKARIAITGYSRAGKMALIAAALDDRIAAVVAGSTGVGGVTPWRLSGEYGMGEGVESTTRSFPIWFHPRLRFFSGKEDRLPVDGNLIVAMVAPRAILIEYGLNDEVTNTWSHEQVYYSARKVFSLLRQPDRIGLLRVPGFHGSNDVEASLDWLDIQFGRSTATWDNKLLFEWSHAQWLKDSGEKIDPEALSRPNVRRPALEKRIRDHGHGRLGESGRRDSNVHQLDAGRAAGASMSRPPVGAEDAARCPERPAAAGGAARGAALPPGGAAAAPAVGRGAGAGPNPGQLRPDVPAWVIQRGGTSFGWVDPGRSLAAMRPMNFGYGVTGHLYYPNNTPAGTRLPAVIWLHGYSYPLGYMWVYRSDTHPILALVNAGYAVLAFDQAGFGSRMGEFAPFYNTASALVPDGTDGRGHHQGGGRALRRCGDRSGADLRVRLHDRRHGGPVRRRARSADQERRLDQRVHADAHRHGGPRHRRPRAVQRGARAAAAPRLLHRQREPAAVRLRRTDRGHRPAIGPGGRADDGSRHDAGRRPPGRHPRETGLQPLLRLRQAHALRAGGLHAPDQRHAGLGGALDEPDPRAFAGPPPAQA